jgi:hypothetical protein
MSAASQPIVPTLFTHVTSRRVGHRPSIGDVGLARSLGLIGTRRATF